MEKPYKNINFVQVLIIRSMILVKKLLDKDLQNAKI